MTINELHKVLGDLILKGHGRKLVLFDTEAQHYHYHMADIGSALFEEEPEPHLALSENKSHHTCTCFGETK